MVNKKIRNVGAPASNTDAATKKYADKNSSGGKTSLLKHHLMQINQPQNNKQTVILFYRDGRHPMTGDVNMNNHKIKNLPTPNAGDQPATKSYTDNNFLKLRRQTEMTGNLNLGAHRIIHLSDPQGTNDAATKIYTDNLVNATVSNYLKRDGTNAMTGDLNTGGHKIINL